jgi:hypothetical protein
MDYHHHRRPVVEEGGFLLKAKSMLSGRIMKPIRVGLAIMFAIKQEYME